LLQLKDCVPIYETVYCTNRPLAVAAGSFLNARVFQAEDEHGNRVENRVLIQNLVSFFIEGEVHNHAAYLVDALIETNSIIKDWPTMAEMLLADEAGETDDQLIEIMVCSVKQAATGESPVGRVSAKKPGPATSTAKDPRLLREERIKITEAFIQTLPRLINKFVMDPEKIASLAQLPLYFELDIYQVRYLLALIN
jgi:cohesin complex subunit SA-1/2